MVGFVDKKSQAENPGNIRFSYKKYYPIRKMICNAFRQKFICDMNIQRVTEILRFGDTQPALVYSVDPLIIAAYSDEMDAVIMLEFPTELAREYGLTAGAHLTTSNVYRYGGADDVSEDITLGKDYLGQYRNFTPVVQLFLGKDDDEIMSRTDLFSFDTWLKVKHMADEYVKARPDVRRNGFYYFLR